MKARELLRAAYARAVRRASSSIVRESAAAIGNGRYRAAPGTGSSGS
jgi:hypothetical protein